MEALDSFVAGSLLRRVRREGHDEGGPACAAFRGAAIFVDISDYTRLAETLCAEGPRGVEELGKTLDSAFRGHVRAVYDTAGEIACFAGDAFIAYWSADDGDVPHALARARQCARRLHAGPDLALGSSAPAAPRLHIGLSAGDLWAARLGAAERWQLLLAGAAVRQACAASAHAAAGETVVASAAEHFGAATTKDDEAASTPEPVATTATADLQAHVPKHVLNYVEEGFSAWVSQRRTICALFARIDGLDDAAPDALARHQAVVTSLNVALRPYTRSTGTLLLDDKGLVFTLCLGMPHDAHADDGLRAVCASLAIREELARLGLGSAIGVAAGPGVCMPIGGSERRHYWSVGRFMHVAGRLMEAADGGVLCTEEVADEVRRAVSLSPERPLTLKGVQRPLRTFRVLRATRTYDQVGPLFGREDEQAMLDRALDAFERQRGSVIWMVGDAGLGKTALVQYLRQAASERRIDCLIGGAGSVEMAVPYAAWRPLFTKLLPDAASALSPDERRTLMDGIRHPQLGPLVNAVVPGFFEETPLTQSLSGQARADATLSVLSEIIGLRATARFVLILEDCHWMDSASWRLVLRIAQDWPQAMFLLTSRPGMDVAELSGLRRLDRFTEIKLSPLRADAIEALVESVLEERPAKRELVEEVVQHAVGNPLFARECTLLLTARLTARDASTGPVRPSRPAEVENLPVTVQELIASRLDGLPPAEGVVLKIASVIGDRFTLDAISAVHPSSTAAPLDSILASLAERQLIAATGPDSQSFVFQHALIREVAYDELTTDQRRQLHRQVAETYERARASDVKPYVAALAHHWSHADVPDRAMRYADQAASQALAAGAFEEADRLLGTCVDFADRGQPIASADRIRWHRQIADARQGMGQLEPRRAAAHEALRRARYYRPHRPAALMGQALTHLCRLGIRRVLPPRQPTDEAFVLDIARAYRHSAEVCYFNNDMLGMVCDSLSAVASASVLKPSAVLAGAATELGGILSVAGLRRTGERILQQAIAMAESANDQAAQAYAHMVSCLYSVGVGDWQSAERSAARCQDLCEPMDDRVNWTNAQAVKFWMSHYRSHDAAAYDAARSLRDRASETGNRQHRAWGFRFLGLCALRRDDSRDAMAQLQSAVECLDETAALNERIPTLGILALAQLRNGEVWAARATANEGLGQIVQVRRPIGHSTLEGYSSLLTVALHAWQSERSPHWQRAIRTCLRILGRYRKSFPVGEPRYYLHLGEYQRASGALSTARRSFRRGEASALRLGMPWDARRCAEGLSGLSPSPGRP